MKAKKTPERFNLSMVVAEVNGKKRRCWIAADDLTAERMKRKGFHEGDIVGAEFKKARSSRQWFRAHKLGQLLIENTDDFADYTDAHKVLKRLQLESGIGCDETAIRVEGLGMVMHRTPQSLAFDAMEEGEFTEIYSGFCQYIINKYWSGLQEYQVQEMAGLVGLAA